jgi:hypothetical protein
MHDSAAVAESFPSTESAEEGSLSSDAVSFESWRSQWYAWYAASGFDPSQREQYLEQVLAASSMGAASESSSALQAAGQQPRTNEGSAASSAPIPGPTSNGAVNTPSAPNAVVTIAESDLQVCVCAFEPTCVSPTSYRAPRATCSPINSNRSPVFLCFDFNPLPQALGDEALADLLTAWYHAGVHAGRVQTIAALRGRARQ